MTSDTAVTYDHLDYDELTRIVLGDESIDAPFIESMFLSTFRQVMTLASQLGGAGRPEQATEIDLLRFLLRSGMTGESLREFFNALDYKVSYIVMILVFEHETNPMSGMRSRVFQFLAEGAREEITSFFDNPLHSLMILDMYREFVGNRNTERFLPFVDDVQRKLLDQLSIDINVFPSFKRLDFTQVRYADDEDEASIVSPSDLVNALVASNSLAPTNIIANVHVVGANPLYRTLHGSEVATSYTQIIEEMSAYVLSVMLRHSMSTTTSPDSIEETFVETCNMTGLTPSILVTLWRNCGCDTKLLTRVVISLLLLSTEDVDGLTQEETHDIERTIYMGIQANLVHNTPQLDSIRSVVNKLPNEVLLIGEFASQHNIETAPRDVEQEGPLPKSMIN